MAQTMQFLDTSVVKIGSTPVLIFPAERGAHRIFQNWGAVSVILGGPDLPAASGGFPLHGNGWLVKGGQTVPDEFINGDICDIYAITSDGSSNYANFSACRISGGVQPNYST